MWHGIWDDSFQVERLCRRTAMLPEGAGLGRWMLSAVQSLFIFSSSEKQTTPDEKLPVDQLDTFEIVSRANYFVNRRDFAAAIKYRSFVFTFV